MSVTNLNLIKDVKKMYIDKADLKEYTVESIRFFCLGKELKDDLYVYSYDIKDEMTIQAMFKKT